MSCSRSSVREIDDRRVVDDHGRPRDPLALRILRLLFSPPFPPPKPSFTIREVAILLAADISNTESIIRQLTEEKILSEDPQDPRLFRYNYDCPFVERQAKLEKHLLDEEMKHKFTSSTVEVLPFRSQVAYPP
jgi:hypothetical protein